MACQAGSRATLRLYAHTESVYGYPVRTVSNQNWNEFTILYDNAPPIGELITLAEPFRAKEWTTADLTSLVRGDGTYDIVLLTFNYAPLILASRNAIPPYRSEGIVEVFD